MSAGGPCAAAAVCPGRVLVRDGGLGSTRPFGIAFLGMAVVRMDVCGEGPHITSSHGRVQPAPMRFPRSNLRNKSLPCPGVHLATCMDFILFSSQLDSIPVKHSALSLISVILKRALKTVDHCLDKEAWQDSGVYTAEMMEDFVQLFREALSKVRAGPCLSFCLQTPSPNSEERAVLGTWVGAKECIFLAAGSRSQWAGAADKCSLVYLT